MITNEQLEQLKSVDIRTIDKETLVDIRTVRVDESASLAERVLQYIEQIRNPYLFRVGDSAVKISFGPDQEMIGALKDYLISLRAGY